MKNKLPIVLFIFIIITACLTPQLQTETPALPVTPLATDTPSVTEEPQESLTVCLGQEPNTLYPFGGPNDAARSVLAACAEGDTLRMQLAALKRFSKFEPVNAVAYRREIARRILRALGPAYSKAQLQETYRALCDCLQAGRMFMN